ncbi:MAG: hypothetical protein JO079_03180 [Frankiaceae bacterium]|nr:hypothetical protein [Frankiaceae bacterium]MBV9369539.1 hypothetical protein [Frankiales bacterium]
MRWPRWLSLAAAVGVLAGAGWLAPAHAATGACGATSAAWTALPLPSGAVTWVAPDDTDGCHLTAGTASGIYVTLNGGHNWTRSQLPTDGPVTGLWSEGLGHDVVMASAAASAAGGAGANSGGLLVSINGGLSFQAAAAGLQGFRLVEARSAGATTAATSNGALVYLLASRSAAALLFVSTDSGSTFLPEPETQAFAPTALAVDPVNPQVVWLNSTANTGSPLWVSTDGGHTFSGKTVPGATSVTDIWLAPRKNASSLVYVATNAGIFSSADSGITWLRLSTAAASNVRTGRGNENALVALTGGRPVAGGAGSALKPWAAGVPTSCTSTSLIASIDYPSAFTEVCGDGRVYRRLSDADRSGDAGDVTPPSNNGGATVPLPLVEAQTWALPGVAAQNAQHSDVTSSTLAFDGLYLYYLPLADQYGATSLPTSSDTGVLTIARVIAATGQPAPDITIPLGKSPGRSRTMLDYDSLTRRLLINSMRGSGSTSQSEIFSYDLNTGTVTKIFPSATDVTQTGIPYVVSDNVSGGYLSANEGQRTLYHLAADGHRINSCDWQTPVGALAGSYGASGLTFTGDGGVYVELEDDQTVYRLDSNCRLVQAYLHRAVSEAAGEDDELACDGQSFSLPAVWLRDAAPGVVTAYLTPGGFCPLPSTMTVTAPRHSPLGKLTQVCAQLRTLTGLPAAAKPIALDVDGAIVGFGPTDKDGNFCAPYRPATPGLKTVNAQFFGSRATPQLLGAAAHATIAVPGVAVVPPAHRPPPAPKAPAPPGAPNPPSTLLATGPSVSTPGQPPASTNQVQQVQSQPGTSAQTAISHNEEQQQQLALQGVENDSQVGLERASDDSEGGLMMMSAAAMLGVAAVLRSRHRRQLALDRLTHR